MTMTDEEIATAKTVVNESLNRAESIWGEVGHNFTRFNNRSIVLANEAVESQIPGHPEIEAHSAEIDDFVAVVADMRDSSKHLMTRIGTAKVTELQRVFYETSALLPGLATVIRSRGGAVTEYLGDGVLALFQAGQGTQRDEAIRSAHRAAQNCLRVVADIINASLKTRYDLPPIDLGIGMSISKAIVSTMGDDRYREGKVFGECVYYASKLSGGRNEIHIDEALKVAWPKSNNGTIHFSPKRIRSVDGYLLQRSN